MKKIAQKLFAVSAACMALASAPASAATLTFLWQWNGSSLHGITTQDGVVIQDANVGLEYGGDYGLFNGQTLSESFLGAYNFYDGNNVLKFTYAPSGTEGNTRFNVPIRNAAAGPITAIPGGTALPSSPVVQNLLTFQAGDDTYTLQFQDLAGSSVPEPATWGMMLAGFGMMGLAMRKRSAVRTTVTYA